ncbi:MAG: cupin [Gammaproteobacteria bacterium]|nr:MAG: cupin [Gammaproteobacteria bacterium]
MELNADFSRRAVVHAAREPWVPSPTPGVERRMLDRIGDEVARATSIVRYAEGSTFPAHTHGGGEEYLVLEGVFQDEESDQPVGTYVRNPPTTRHRPRSESGCTIFVKLWQFDPDDRKSVRIATRSAPWAQVPERPGVEVMSLHADRNETVRLERWAPDTHVVLTSDVGLEVLVLEGRFMESAETFEALSWLRVPAGKSLRAHSGPNGARIWLKLGVQPASLRFPRNG